MTLQALSFDDIERLTGVRISQDWNITPVYRETLAGFFITRGPEIHAWRLPEYEGRWLTRQNIERLTKPLFHLYGHVSTSVRVENLAGHRFVQRLGFKPTGSDDRLVYYKTESLKHARL